MILDLHNYYINKHNLNFIDDNSITKFKNQCKTASLISCYIYDNTIYFFSFLYSSKFKSVIKHKIINNNYFIICNESKKIFNLNYTKTEFKYFNSDFKQFHFDFNTIKQYSFLYNKCIHSICFYHNNYSTIIKLYYKYNKIYYKSIYNADEILNKNMFYNQYKICIFVQPL